MYKVALPEPSWVIVYWCQLVSRVNDGTKVLVTVENQYNELLLTHKM